VFRRSDRTASAAIERVLEAEAASRLALEADFFVRTAKEWRAIVDANPFPREARKDPGHLVLMCLKAPPAKSQVNALQAAIVGKEVVHASDRQLYVVFPDELATPRLPPRSSDGRRGRAARGGTW